MSKLPNIESLRQADLQTLRRLYVAAFAVALLSGAIGLLLSLLVGETTPEIRTFLQTLGIALMLISIPVGLKFFHDKTKLLREQEPSANHQATYCLWWCARLAFVSISLCVSLLLFAFLRDNSMFFCALMSAVALIFCKPNKQEMIVFSTKTNKNL